MIVTAHGQQEFVTKTLASLRTSVEHAPFDVEVVLVDNRSAPRLLVDPSTGPPDLRLLRRPPVPGEDPFDPGAARNRGLRCATGEHVVFLDGDCLAPTGFLAAHLAALTSDGADTVSIGHRRFVDSSAIGMDELRRPRWEDAVARLGPVASASNYGLAVDRRMPELLELERHPFPSNCCHACNLGVPRALALRVGGFDRAFDGHWGYEDIEFGARLQRAGARFVYAPDAFVLHQEGHGLSRADRERGRERNLRLAFARMPGFEEFRARQARPYYDS